jgi:hypothetical protein
MDADPFAGEYETLLPGESVSMRSDDPRDVDHWITVYSELVSFKEKILNEIGEQRDKVEATGRLEIQHDDMIFRREYMRLVGRLNFWRTEKERRSA